jgi:cyclopropane-fatty-acyl-phospholipid synthase
MSSQPEVEVSYDVGNEFFALWLDHGMNYTCGVWDGVSNLEDAQRQKLSILHDLAHITPASRVLDIGCGWGSALEYLVVDREVEVAHGITLSEAQANYAQHRAVDGMTVSLCDYRDYEPDTRFDSVLSICMMEHIATPQQARRGEHLPLYRDFFRRVHSWTTPGAWFGLQTILRDRIPRDPSDLHDINWATQTIFPGGLSLRLEDVVRTVSPYWEIIEIHTRRDDYRRTTAAWLQRLCAHEHAIRAGWGDVVFDEYRRYLSTCVRAFERRYQSLAQYSLRRISGTTRGARGGHGE